MTRLMYDGITPAKLPKGGDIYASYIDGEWPYFSQLVKLFPHAKHLSIAVDPTHDADILDVERYDALPSQAPDWVYRQRHRSITPIVYMNAATWPTVKQAFYAQHVTEPYYWVADYDHGPTIPTGAIAVQWKNTPGYDQSTVIDYIEGVDSMSLTDDDVAKIWGASPAARWAGSNGVMYPASTWLVNANKYAGEAMLQTVQSSIIAAIEKALGTTSSSNINAKAIADEVVAELGSKLTS